MAKYKLRGYVKNSGFGNFISDVKKTNVRMFRDTKNILSIHDPNYKLQWPAYVLILGYILAFLGFCTMFMLLNNANSEFSFTTQGFLEFLQNLTTETLNIRYPKLDINANWGAFNFLRNFINVFANILEILLYLGQNIIAIINVIIQVVEYIFTPL